MNFMSAERLPGAVRLDEKPDALPFQAALGDALALAAPKVREHFLQQPGTRRYRGTMRRVWRREDWRGWLAAPFLAFFLASSSRQRSPGS